jgi:hypothetical protein
VNPACPSRDQQLLGRASLLDNKYYLDRFNEVVFAGGARAARHAGSGRRRPG